MGPPKEGPLRPRERYTIEGPDHFDDAELLALVLGTGTGGRSAVQIARDLLDRFGGFSGLRQAPPGALAGVLGVGQARAVRVHAACAMARGGLRRPPPTRVLTPEQAWGFFAPRVAELEREELHALYLGRRGRVLSWRSLTVGNDSFTIVDPRQILRPAIRAGALSIILAHNHPSGDPAPSDADRRCTRRVAQAGQLLGVALLDHLVIGEDGFTSLAEQGELPAWTEQSPVLTG